MSGTARHPDDGLLRLLDELQARLGALERRAPPYQTVDGPRTDLPSGRGPRVRTGLLTDGSYGIERWTEAGVRQIPTWNNA